ncbi:glycosyltransferase family 4 protein [Fictibacillus enclensis]|uniref:glycosyltransferase family 4 protein n=1 Tax=Fictibacillus enclensis TaxID=1017270 RepID=UPI0025A01C21|nr:glycosyltransferase family 4 protein [Fictibacillus enclensis]MDM5340540.1 glycosyltransferase family 4 protein [Fictibacillus enclensis]
MKLAFFDTNNDGHHWFYNSELMINLAKQQSLEIIYITREITKEQVLVLKRNDIEVIKLDEGNNSKLLTKNFFQQFRFLKDYHKAHNIVKKKKIDLFINLYFDRYIIQYFLINKKIKTINVLHWVPNNKIKIKILSYFNNKRDIFVVHTGDAKHKLNKINEKIEVTELSYPVKNHSGYNKLSTLSLGIDNLKGKSLLYFGGTRYDKGLDILLQALRLVESNINIFIVGKEDTFDKKFIENEILDIRPNIKVITKLDYIPEEEVLQYFDRTDGVILPYRAFFNGESGVLTDALQMGKPVIVPDIIHFPKIINQYKNGIIYKVENVEELAKAIDILATNYDQYYLNAKRASVEIINNRSSSNFAAKFYDIINLVK